ncbi:O-antigen ligase family protein [uncultured Nocardioides sp.]|uniref:O-antigen ligase family protein n=1 Tax=uncultured Nocardioides sp. TaxID=198441 RepID=UPI0026393328|nr:O-antigen ligase family protein [uncultured Nocardioides sp.]
MTTRSSQLRAGRDPIPATRPRGTLAFVLPLLVAAAAGLALGLSPHAALAVEAAVLSALVLVLRLDWAALAVIATAAFQDYLDLISPWATQWLAGVLVLAWLVRRAQGPLHGPLPGSQHGHRLRVPALLVALLLGAVLIAYLAHPLGRPGLTVCATYAEFAIVMLILADTLGGPLAPHRAARVFVVSCVLASCCGLVTAIGSGRHQVAGPVASPDTLAFFLIAAVPLVGTVRSRESQPVWWVWACFVILLGAGIGTQSRPAFVALVAMVVVAVATGLLALRYAGALLAVVLTAVALLVAVLPMPIGQALTDPQRYADTNISQRNDLRMAAFEMTLASPVVGLGPASFALLHQDYASVDDRGDGGDRAEPDLDTAYSTVLEASAELGVLGLGALYAVWLFPVIRARGRWTDDRSGVTAATLLAAAGVFTAAALETQQYTLPLWFLSAMLLALGRPEPRRTPVFGAVTSARSSGQVPPRS